MTPVRHQVSGQALQFALQEEVETVKRELTGTTTRSARTLVKDGPLRVTLVGVNPGGELRPHKADGPITLQVLEGEIHFDAEGQRWTLAAGSLFALDAGITHSVQSPSGGIFLLTVVAVSGSTADASKDATSR